jgi:hypothetical protein
MMANPQVHVPLLLTLQFFNIQNNVEVHAMVHRGICIE